MGSSRSVVEWYRRRKKHLVQGFGGKCALCGYDRFSGSLEFHHLNPAEKDFHLGSSPTISWERTVSEITKCVMLCSNCHREVHAGMAEIPENAPRFDESQTGYTVGMYIKPAQRTICQNCGEKESTRSGGRFCSPQCAKEGMRKVPRPTKSELAEAMEKYGVRTKVAKLYGVSDTTIKKWQRSYDLI